ncbi:hypothetical protein [Leadbettera azotonutricia]|uniref:Uncharacterized protein n=1 Tax=Leadbettera azotonutricia (strain ATCC BAA-888 / DSM 13862 / ZAS-9) TaxID=545695 RepID=F5YCD7_LEAAZ|nr:hypothetical protein [Leadbettera azotonutricia]AEF80373.1 hypothetical protein TREAZ_2875 [Leadbettera azotonutricia ZAS-9]
MVIERTVEIPADRHLHLDFDLPEAFTPGATVVFTIVPPAEPPNAYDTSADPPSLEEISQIRERVEQLDLPLSFTSIESALEEAARRTVGAEAEEFRRMAGRFRYYLEHSELWDEAVRTVREMRAEWDDPWDPAVQAAWVKPVKTAANG